MLHGSWVQGLPLHPANDADVIEILPAVGGDRAEEGRQRFEHGHFGTQPAPDRAHFQPDHTRADDRQRPGQALQVKDFIRIEDRFAVERNVGRTIRLGADSYDEPPRGEALGSSVGCNFDMQRIDEPCFATDPVHAVAGKLVFEDFHLMIQCDRKPPAQVLRRDRLLVPMRPAVEATLAPAGKIEHRLAQRLRRYGAGMHTYAADAPALLDHEHGFLQLRRLHSRAPSGGAGADNDQIIGLHGGQNPPPRMLPLIWLTALNCLQASDFDQETRGLQAYPAARARVRRCAS